MTGFDSKREMAADKVLDLDGHVVGKVRKPKPAQEPVAWGVFEDNNLHDMLFTQEEAQELARYKGSHTEVRPLYTIPPQRPWVGLTAEETSGFTSQEMTVVKYVSKVLQEKNT